MNSMTMLLALILFSQLLVCFYKADPETGVVIDFGKESTMPLRGILCLGIILHHTYIWIFDVWGGVIVSVFFFLSGYGLVKSYKVKKDVYFQGYFRKKFEGIVLPFMISIVAFHIINFSFFKIPYETMLPALFSGDTKIILPTSWYIFAISLVYIAYFLIAKVTCKIERQCLIMTILTLLFAVATKLCLNWDSHWRISALALPIGVYVSCYEEKIISSIRLHYKLLVYSVSAIVLLMLLFATDERLIQVNIYLAGVVVPICTYLFFSVVGLNSILLKSIGSISLEVYLVQGAVTMYLRLFIVNNYIYSFLSVLLSVTAGYLLWILKNAIIVKYKLYLSKLNNE